jgi:DNA-binding transcriptional LysR family regulator
MPRIAPKYNLNDLMGFVTVARERSFTRAASKLGVSQSALSQAIAGLEAKLQLRLLTRTTRSVSVTAAGERLMQTIDARFDGLEAELDSLSALHDKPAGTVRITCGDHIVKTTLLPKLMPLLRHYPDIKIEFDINYGFRDIVADRFDAGVRFGETLDKDMIAVPIGDYLRLAVVASPDYFTKFARPKSPKDLENHRCINLRFPTHGNLDIWEFERNGRKLKIRVDGPMIFNTTTHVVDAALGGMGVAYLPEAEFSPFIEEQRLVRVLEEWCPSFPGYHLYYPSRRQPSPAFSLVVDTLKFEQK